MILTLTKHHGLGNDFLVLLDPAGAVEVTAELARRLCDRRLGVGADGLLHTRKSTAGADVDITVWNADGSVAETSGNGLRCGAQAVADAGWAGAEFLMRTGGETRQVRVGPESAPGERQVSVSMGRPRIQPVDPPPWGSRAAKVDTGNPHLVVEVPGPPEMSELAAASDGFFAEPVNAEAIQVLGDDHLRLWVWERGAGQTRACGSGSVASAAAARSWGLVGDRVEVTNPGGDVVVDLSDDGEALLTGPAIFVGRIEVDPDRIRG